MIKAPKWESPRKAIELSDACGFANIKGDLHNLLCPRCGAYNLHQGKVVVNPRAREDEPEYSTVVEGSRTYVIKDPEAHTGRRDCLAVEFSCEHCGDAVGVLRIVQHKGTTYIYWEL